MKKLLIATFALGLTSTVFAQTANPLQPAAPRPAVTAPQVQAPAVTAPTPKAAPAPAATAEKPKRAQSEGQIAANERRKKCGVEWKAAKAANKTEGLKWPQFYSKCNTRLKGA